MIYHASAYSPNTVNLISIWITFNLAYYRKMWMCNVKPDFSWVHTSVMHFWFLERAQFFSWKFFLLTMSLFMQIKCILYRFLSLFRCARAPRMTTVRCKPFAYWSPPKSLDLTVSLSLDKNDSLLLFLYLFVYYVTLRYVCLLKCGV